MGSCGGLLGCLGQRCTSPAPHAVTAGLTAGCSTQVAASRLLGAVRPVTAPVPGSPTAVVGTADGWWAFVSVSAGNGGEIAVMALGRGTLRLVRAVPLPGSMTSAFGMALTHDGRLLLVAGYTATAVMSVSALEDGHGDPVAGAGTPTSPARHRARRPVPTRPQYRSGQRPGAHGQLQLRNHRRIHRAKRRIGPALGRNEGIVPRSAGQP
jgi:hypothetical protein